MLKHIILDTDIWGDPDDVFALLLALNSPEVHIDLIVTSDEHVGHRAQVTNKFLELLGCDVPVVRGIDLGNDRWCMVCDRARGNSEADFVSAIKTIVEKNRITDYVCIGPQSNLAKFLENCPELAGKIKILIMGGAINYRKKNKPEHNVRLDIEAARRVFYFDVDKRYVISDTTYSMQILIDRDHPIYKRLLNFGSPAKDILIGNLDNFFTRLYPGTIMHDPLTLSYLVKPEILSFEKKNIEMNNAGVMKLSDIGRPSVVSVNADYKAFMKLLGDRMPF